MESAGVGRPGAPISSYFPIFRQADSLLVPLELLWLCEVCIIVVGTSITIVYRSMYSSMYSMYSSSTVLYVVLAGDVREHVLLFARSRPTQCVVRIPRLNLSECTSQVLSENVLLILSQRQHGLIN